MSDLEKKVLDYVMERIKWHKETNEDHYDFWEQHIKYVYKEAIELARKYNANEEVVRLGALLHDIALIEKYGTREEHNVKGKELAEKILVSFNCPEDIMDRVLGCVLHHRSSKNAENIEEICVADADILAHFDNISIVYDVMYTLRHMQLAEVRKEVKEYIEKDFNDLSPQTHNDFQDRYEIIKSVICGSDDF